MISKKILYGKKIVRRKMMSVVTFGIIFLITSLAYYYVNFSNAQNVIDVSLSVIDKDFNAEIIASNVKASETQDGYKTELSCVQNGLVIKKYNFISESEYNELKQSYDEKNKKEDAEDTTEEDTDEEEEKEEEKEDDKGEDEEKELDYDAKQEYILNDEEIQNQKLFATAEYDYKEVDGQILFNKIITSKNNENIIKVMGYMPEKAELKVTEIKKEDVENKIRDMSKEDNLSVNLNVAYDIKIVVDENEYEPEFFDEEVTVLIEGIKNKNINIWHIKDNDSVEKINQEEQKDKIKFKTNSFSIYGIEEVNENESTEQPSEDQPNIEDNSKKTIKAVRAPARATGDSTLVIDDYDSDYYYYKGQNYTSTIAGTFVNNYPDSNLAKVTINYHGYALADASNNDMKGRISLTETEDIVQNIKCVPVSGGNATIELMENPFMDKPTGYGFGGWSASAGNVTPDAKTLTYTLTLPVSGDTTVDLYAIWTRARVVYLNPEKGCDDYAAYDGSSEDKPLGSWRAACNKLYTLAASTDNRADRENNIIVLTGDIDSSINYTRPVTYDGGTQTVLVSADANYQTAAFATNTQLLITDGSSNGEGANALSGSSSALANETLTSSLPAEGTRWTITGSNGSYSIRNDEGYYLTASNSNTSTLSLSTTRFASWYYSNGRFYYRRYRGGWTGGYYYFYLDFDGNNWTFDERKTGTGNYGTQVSFLSYTTTNEVYEERLNTSTGNFATNTYYSNGNNTYNLALTVTSLYNHTDYRDQATIDLTTNGRFDFTIYKNFQMNHVKINATGYRTNADGDTFSDYYPKLVGRNNNVRIGRGIVCANTTADGCAFANLIGGNVSSYDSTAKYKCIVESGKYSSIQGFNSESYSHSGIVYLILGSDIDRVKVNNSDMAVYFELTVARGSGTNGSSSNDKAFLIDVKSGSYGIDFFEQNGKNTAYSAYSGIYVGGYSSGNNGDPADRYCIVEGGLISNIIGGLKVTSGSSVKTRIYVKGGDIYNIVGGSGVSVSYGDRIIQMTSGTVRYSISGGSNGVWAGNNTGTGQLQGNTLVYVGGNANIGTSATLGDDLYDVEAGCVLGAGNGNYNQRASAGQVYSSHIIINDEAHILNSVYGGGNYGIVRAASGTTNATTKIEILGGTIDGNVYGGANQNSIYGSTTINIKDGEIKGAVYGGSNSDGTIYASTNIEITGGTIGVSSDTSKAVLFGGGYGSSTVVSRNTNINILDTSNNVEIYGNCYGGSAQGTITGNTTVYIQDIPSDTYEIDITGNVFAGGQGTASQAATINGNSTISVNGSNLPDASIFGGNDINGTTNGNITVNIGTNTGTSYPSVVGRVYGGGNQDATGTEADTVKVYLYNNADVEYAFNGGKSANFTTSGVNDTNRGIYLQGGHADNLFGGSDTSGTVNASHVYIQSGTATNVYGGNNVAGQTTTSTVSVTGGTVTNVYGGGYQATTTTTNVSLTGGTITNGFGGGDSANVTTANITLNGTSAQNIYGGSNELGTVNQTNVTITSGTVTNVFGGNNAGGTSGNTNVVVTSQATNVYGGGNEAKTTGNTSLRLTNATITGDAYGGGNGSAAIVSGNSTTYVEGTTSIANDLFGGGNAAPNGNTTNNNSTVTTYITGGTIGGDVYGAANTSVVYGNTVVKIGEDAVGNSATMSKNNISIGGTVFGGGKSNSAGSAHYDFTFESVTGDANIDIDANGYNGNNTYTLNIGKSIFGSGNAAKISGNGTVNLLNYGTASEPKTLVSIQRATTATLNNCYLNITGTTDTTNEIATAVYTFNRIDDLILKNNTTLFLASGVNIVSAMESLDASGNKERVTIDNSGVTYTNTNNRIFLSQGRNIILKTEAGTDGEVKGMAYVGLYTIPSGSSQKELGIYGDSYTQGSTVPSAVAEIFNRNSYVQGKHYTGHNIEVDGFFTKYNVDDKIEYQFIDPTPEDASYYQWIMGEVSSDLYFEDIELIATKYSTTGTYVLNLNGLSFPNTIIDVVGFDTSDLASGITMNDPSTLPNIAPTATEADSNFGLTMTTGNNGWQTRGTTYFLDNATNQETFDGRTQYLSDNSTTTPSFSLYLAHSKNISSTENLGTVTIHLVAKYVDEHEVEQTKNVYIIVKITTNNTTQIGSDYYEGAIAPGKEYSIFPTTTTTITKKSTFSAYYSLYVNNYSTLTDPATGELVYYTGFTGHYYHSIETSNPLPANTKITLIDKSGSTVKYYYYIVSASDASANKKVIKFTDFYAMDSEQEHYSADGSYYNSSTDLLYEEFIVHVNFEDTTISSNLENNNIQIQLRDIYDDNIKVTVNTALYPMLYSVYNDIDTNSSLELSSDKNVIYIGDDLGLDIETEYSFNKNDNDDIVYDTTHIEDEMGVRITVSSGSNPLSASDLEGIYISYGGLNYFPRSDGSYRIKIADAVSNVLAKMTLHTGNADLDTATYTITAQSFGSSDGTYFSSAIASDSVDVQIVSSDFGFVVELDPNAVLIDKSNGKNKTNTNNLNFTIGYSGEFQNPKIAVSLYRRKYDRIVSAEYELVDLRSFVTNTLTATSNTNEYVVTNSAQSTQNYTLTTKNSTLRTGTYKVVFTLYDGTNKISDMEKYIIIK